MLFNRNLARYSIRLTAQLKVEYGEFFHEYGIIFMSQRQVQIQLTIAIFHEECNKYFILYLVYLQ